MIIQNEQEMQQLGERIAHSIENGAIINLVGDVGAGKTTLVRGIARGLAIDEAIQSPSFTINRVYDAGERRLVHYDFYRLHDPGIMADEFAETVTSGDIVVVEWGEVIEHILPKDYLTITIKPHGETKRLLNFESNGPVSDKMKEQLQ